MKNCTVARILFWGSTLTVGSAVTAAGPEERHPPELVSLAEEFREWRSGSRAEFSDYVQRVEEQEKGLAQFRRRLRSLNPHGWPVHARVDYLVLLIEMNALEFDLEVVRPVSRNPDFFTDQAIRRVTRNVGGRYQMGPGVTVPYDAKRSAAIIQAITETKSIVEQAPSALIEAVPEMADMTIERLESVGQYYREFAEAVGPHMPEPYRSQIGPAAEKAGAALEDYRRWLLANRAKMTAPYAIGRPAFDWYVRNVTVMPYDGESILTQAETERHRNWAYLQFERQKNRHLPGYDGPVFGGKKEPLPVSPVDTFAEYSELKDATDVLTRLWAEKHALFTRPDYLGPMRVAPGGVFIGRDRGVFGHFGFPTEATPSGTKTEFMVERDHWFSLAYQEFAKWMDPGINHPHSDYGGHTLEGAISRRTTCDLRRPHRTRGDAWEFYMEDLQLQLDYPFVRGPRVREWMYAIALWRAERLVVGVKLADGTMTPKEAEQYLIDNVPLMDSFKAKRMDVWYSLARPAFTLKYQVVKFELFKLLMDRMRQLGDEFNLTEFHEAFFATGQIPISLARWEMAGIDDDVKHLWERHPIPETPSTSAAR